MTTHTKPTAHYHRPVMAFVSNGEKPMGYPLRRRLLRCRMALALVAGALGSWVVNGAEPDVTSPPSPAPHADAPAAVETPEQAQRRALATDHGAEIADAILAGTVLKGMTLAQVLLARGAPARKEVIPPDAELWYYPEGEVAFSAGRVSYVSLAARSETPSVRPTPRTQRDETRGRAERDPSGHEQPTRVDIPPIRVGDSYVYESKDLDDPRSSLTTRRTVTSTRGKVVLSSINLDRKNARARNLHFNREWNLIATRNADDDGVDYSPPLKYYDFPLFPGKTWRQTTTETHIKTGATRTHAIEGVVGEWETVSVPAGTFRALKVSLQTELFDPSTGERITGADVSWYVPEVRRSVKSLTTGKDGSQRLIQLLRYELGANP